MRNSLSPSSASISFTVRVPVRSRWSGDVFSSFLASSFFVVRRRLYSRLLIIDFLGHTHPSSSTPSSVVHETLSRYETRAINEDASTPFRRQNNLKFVLVALLAPAAAVVEAVVVGVVAPLVPSVAEVPAVSLAPGRAERERNAGRSED